MTSFCFLITYRLPSSCRRLSEIEPGRAKLLLFRPSCAAMDYCCCNPPSDWPAVLQGLGQLEHLNVVEVGLLEAPVSLERMHSLKSLHLSGCKVSLSAAVIARCCSQSCGSRAAGKIGQWVWKPWQGKGEWGEGPKECNRPGLAPFLQCFWEVLGTLSSWTGHQD